ncbi:hypothetical protein [Kitasatospora sp. NPDC085879]|uniref:hypothetical protein n=1 Tax=Kitasatospora sp. NPDC085879 TaxID=3154769 RepID=UPI00341A5F52
MNSPAWMRISISGSPTYARMHTSTNDDRDLGYPSGDASWTDELRPTEQRPDALAYARELAGVSRVGISGIEVEVFVNGERV